MKRGEREREREREKTGIVHMPPLIKTSPSLPPSLPLGIPGRRRPRFDGLAWHVVGSGAGEGAREGGFPFLSWAKL